MGKKLVVGGAGYIGSSVTHQLLENGSAVKVLDKFIYNNYQAAANESELIIGDVRDISTLHSAMKGCDTVIYLAELVGDPACNACPDLTQELNYIAPCTTAMIAKELGVACFIYMSSCSVYGISSEGLLTEGSVCNPVSEYGRKKVAVEHFLHSISDHSFAPIIFRLATVHGLSARPRFDLMVNALTATAVTDKRITITGGSEWRPCIHVADVARALAHAVSMPITEIAGETFNLGSGENYQIIDIGQMVNAAVPDATFEVYSQLPNDRRSYRVETSKFLNKTGFEPIWNMQESINQLKTYLTENPNWRSEEYSNVATVTSKVCQI